MKKIMLTVLACITFCAYLSAQLRSGINFDKKSNWVDIIKQAKKDNKYIFLDIYTTWCGPCRQMETDVFSDTVVGKQINQNFISARVQMDSTSSDEVHIKNWYQTAKQIGRKYSIAGYPTYLFFDPEGNLVHRDIGYKPKNEFLSTALFALNPEIKKYHANLKKWRAKKLDPMKLPELITTTNKLLGDKKLAAEMARDFVATYLNKVDEKILLNNVFFTVINENGGPSLLNSGDKLFGLAYNHPAKVDSSGGYADYYVTSVIHREEVTPFLFKDDKPISEEPDWERLISNVTSKYSKINLDRFFGNEKLSFYRTIGNWEKYSELVNADIEKFPRKTKYIEQNGMWLGDAWGLNAMAWDLFLNTDNKIALQNALRWSDMSIMLEQPTANVQFFDTKANILYRLGRVKEAIIWEQLAIEACKIDDKLNGRTKPNGFIKDYGILLEKMKAGLPTWPEKK